MSPTTRSSHHTADIAILGSGFAGSILALVLNKIGLKPIVIDKTTHPRFAIGESSTPIGNMILRDLSERYNLPRLAPLTTFGAWRDTYPHLVNGRKRGFSYFQHEHGIPFKPSLNHDNELLVTASADNERCDTHWLRADTDHFLINEVKDANIPVLENTQIQELNQLSTYSTPHKTGKAWCLKATQDQKHITIEANFVVDATGSTGLVARYLNLPDISTQLYSNSHALFSHFEHLPTWHNVSTSLGAQTINHPYYCDDAAVHHCIKQGWMWMLRFVDGRVSAGFALHGDHYRINYSESPEEGWQVLLNEYPTLKQVFKNAQFTTVPGKLYRTGRLQRLWGKAAGKNWALLPHTTGFIDPLHSTGIAHSLSGIERLARLFESHWGSTQLENVLKEYSEKVISELKLIDLLVAGCYPCFGEFELLTSYTMLYFTAAITYEERRMATYRSGTPFHHDFLCVDEKPLVQAIRFLYARLMQITTKKPTANEISQFREEVKAAIQPYNTAGLFNPKINNMYKYTATD